MKTLMKISIYLQIGLLFTFFLPFFPSSCKDAQEEPIIDTSIVEKVSIPEINNASDSIEGLVGNDSISDTLKHENKSLTSGQSDVEETTVDRLIKRFHFLKILLKPNNKYSGLGYIVDVFWPLVTSFGIVLSLIFWIIGLRLKKKGIQDFHILNILGLVFLYTTHPAMLAWLCLSESRLWGYWFCFWWAVAIILLDFGLAIKKKITSA